MKTEYTIRISLGEISTYSFNTLVTLPDYDQIQLLIDTVKALKNWDHPDIIIDDEAKIIELRY